MQRQLYDIERKYKDLYNGMEQIRAKEKYQLRQIKQSQDNLNTRSVASAQMGQNQVDSMKDVLRQDGEKIGDMVKSLNSIKKDLMINN
jgi:hypothetical protein